MSRFPLFIVHCNIYARDEHLVTFSVRDMALTNQETVRTLNLTTLLIISMLDKLWIGVIEFRRVRQEPHMGMFHREEGRHFCAQHNMN